MDKYAKHEWTDETGKTWIAVAGAESVPYGFVVSKAVGVEILRLAKENAELRAIIERDGDIRRVTPVLDAALKERDRLRPLLERCLEELRYCSLQHPLDNPRLRSLTDDLRRELGMTKKAIPSQE